MLNLLINYKKGSSEFLDLAGFSSLLPILVSPNMGNKVYVTVREILLLCLFHCGGSLTTILKEKQKI